VDDLACELAACRYVSQHWGIAWAGFDSALAASLGARSAAGTREQQLRVRAAPLMGNHARSLLI
jgi:hypothetical protein